MGIWVDGFSGFGLFHLLTNLIGTVGWKNKEYKMNKKMFEQTYSSDKGTYLDCFGVERTPKGEYLRTTIEPYSQDLVQYNKNHQIIRNLSMEKRVDYMKKTGGTVLQMSEENIHTHDKSEVFGIRYMDRYNKNEYVIRWLKVPEYGRVLFYMDVNNAHLVRMTDGEIRLGKPKDIKKIDKFISEFNIKQDSCKKHIWEKFYNSDNFVDLKENNIPLY